jgi:3-oxoacyl-[acyl-carrier-protein] synthase-3
MSMNAFIKAIAYFLPDKIRSNAEISGKFPEWTNEKIISKIGIKERRIADKEEFASDLAINACEKLFLDNDIKRSSIDFLLYCTQSPDYFLPTTACILQDKLGLSKSIGALDFNLGCSGFVYGLSIAKGLIVSKAAKNILLVTSETYSKYINPLDKSNLTIFGDAAAATLICANDGVFKINDFVFGTDGTGAENLIVKNGGSRNPSHDGVDVINDGLWINNNNNLFMNGNAIFQFTINSIPNLVNDVLNKNQLLNNDIDYYIFHQANKFILDNIGKRMNITSSKILIDLESCGNTVSSTIPIVLQNAITNCIINKDKKILLAGFGVGYSWAGTTLG